MGVYHKVVKSGKKGWKSGDLFVEVTKPSVHYKPKGQKH